MVRIYRPSWDDFERLLEASATRVLICSPYITASGVDRLFQALPSDVGLELITRLSPSDWTSGVSDPEAIVELLEAWDGDGNSTNLQVAQRLHAKLYSADNSRVIVGSSNLSDGGFDHNVELVAELSGSTAEAAVHTLLAECSQHSRGLSIQDLRAWIERSREAVKAARRDAAGEPDTLSSVQADLDSVLRFGTGSSAPEPEDGIPLTLDRFVSWLEANPDLPGARVILSRHQNSRGQNLTGHVKQCFFGSVRFLQQHHQFLSPTAAALDEMSPEEVYQLAHPGLQGAWTDYLDAHALDCGELYSYSTLRGILPPSFGGTRLGGGGGISTLKRMLPLVARCIANQSG